MNQFRVWNNEKGRYESSTMLLSSCGNIIEISGSDLNNCKESLYKAEFNTGKKDSEGNYIFQGDIVRAVDDLNYSFTGVIEYSIKDCCYIIREATGAIHKIVDKSEMNDGRCLVELKINYFVLGNINEDRTLLLDF